jgi:hypothetical protein
VKLADARDKNAQSSYVLFVVLVDEKRKSKTTHMVLLEIIKEEGL